MIADDVQWLDPQSHQILAFVAHRGVAAGLCVLGAALRGDAAAALELIAEAEHCPAVHRGSSILARAQTGRGIAYISSGRHLMPIPR